MNRRTQFNVKLTKAEKNALRILSAIGDLSMGDYIREEAIIAAWKSRFPDVPLGRDPSKHNEENNKESEQQ